MKRVTRFTAIMAAAAVGLTLSACSPEQEASSDESSGSLGKITVSIPPVADSLPVFVAIDNGYFDDLGLEVELVPAANGATAVNSLVSQSTDVALVSVPTLISAKAGGLPVTIAALGIEGVDDYEAAIYVLEDSPIDDLEGLIGKKMATPSLKSIGDIFARGELLDANQDPEGVQYVELPQSNMASALSAGDVDAAFITEPTLSEIRKTLELRPLAVQNGPQGLFATSEDTLDERSDAIKAFREAIAKGVADIEEDPSGVAEATMPNHTSMDANTAANMKLPRYVTEFDPSGFQDMVDLMLEVKLIEKKIEAKDFYRSL
ncbi:ABC transporter substrate-binding protein [Salinibacterium sp. GXW1014]|uniref:ABC transporter substrate-binding protein n=1 Tax=Salinibacterium sp. GXW1014 TaxID=3377838 RepID=UPI00383B72E3